MERKLAPMCDLCGIANHYGGAVKGFKPTVRVLKKIDTPGCFNGKPVEGNVEWVLCGLFWVDIDLDFATRNCKNPTTRAFIENLEANSYAYGCINACVPKGSVLKSDGTVKQDYCTLSGSIGVDYRNKAALTINNWGYDNGNFTIKPAFVTKFDAASLTTERCAVFNTACHLSMSALISNLNAFDIDGLIICGSAIKGSVPPPLLKPSTYVDVDENNIITGRIYKSNTPTVTMVPVAEYDVYSGDGISSEAIGENGLVLRNGRAYYNRDTFYENESFITGLGNLVSRAEEKVKKLAKQVRDAKDFDIKGIKDALITAIKDNYNRKPQMGVGMTGKALLKTVLNKALHRGIIASVHSEELSEFMDVTHREVGLGYISIRSADAETWYLSISSDKAKAMEFLTHWQNSDFDECSLEEMCCIVREGKLIMLFIEEILKLNSGLSELVDVGNSLFSLLMENPYKLIYLNSSLSIIDLDKLAMLFGLFGNKELEPTRCVAYIHSIMTDENNFVVNCRTALPVTDLYVRLKYGFEVSASYQRSLTSNMGYLVDKFTMVNANTYLSTLPNGYKTIFTQLPIKSGSKFIYAGEVDIKAAVKNYVDSGLGSTVLVDNVDYIADYFYLYKEYSIYQACKNLSKVPVTKYSDETKSEIIADFEKLKGIKLEEKQKQVGMSDSPVMALLGAGGTGKTTTAELLLYKLQRLENIADDDIMFVAPTGCASNKLKRTVKRPASTIHSCLRLGTDRNLSIIQKQGKRLSDIKVVVCDECSMITVDIMYELLSGIDTTSTRVYFLGDIAQLLAIGFGKPFANMLRYLPCVTLEVSKRAAENSGITKNANLMLDVENMQPLTNTQDFKMFPCTYDKIQNKVVKTCEHFLGLTTIDGLPVLNNLSPDDIQVVTPVKKASFAWGSTALNGVLRPLFNPDDGSKRRVYFMKNGEESYLMEGDRVVNLKNHAGNIRHVETEKGSNIYDTLTTDTGVFNGDIGVIYRIVDGANVSFASDELLSKKSKALTLEARKEFMYLFVKYKDVDISTGADVDFLIAYPLRKLVSENLSKTFVNEIDVSELELAYALTTHKMQGSEAKVIVVPLLDLKYSSDFMCNNMLYTSVTRAKSVCIMYGDVSGPYSTLERMRKVLVLDKRFSLFDKY